VRPFPLELKLFGSFMFPLVEGGEFSGVRAMRNMYGHLDVEKHVIPFFSSGRANISTETLSLLNVLSAYVHGATGEPGRESPV
jgi:hypothetical protein